MKIADALLRQTLDLPAAAGTTTGTVIDLGAANVGPIGAGLDLVVSFPALANLVEAKTAEVKVYHCATSAGTFALVKGVGNLTVVGDTGDGAAAESMRFYLPPETQQFLRFDATVETGGGDNTASDVVVDFKV